MEKIGRYTLQLADGQEVKIAATYGLLLKLREQNKAAYQHYNEATKELTTDTDFAIAEILYSAYLMGLIDDGHDTKDAMPEEEFFDRLSFDRVDNLSLVSKLIAPNHPMASVGALAGA